MRKRSERRGWRKTNTVTRTRWRGSTWLLLGLVGAQLWVGRASAEDEPDLKELARVSAASVVLMQMYDGQQRKTNTGTGFFINETTLVTNHHVIEGARAVRIRLASGAEMAVSDVLAEDAAVDLAILRTDRVPGVGLDLYRGPRVEPGEKVVVLGSPEGLQGSLTDGIVSAWRDEHEELSELATPILQISAPISPGSSGSPVMNLKGAVLGVAVAVHASRQSLNFAVPVDALRSLLASTGAEPVRVLGAETEKIRPTLIRNIGLSILACIVLGLFLRRL